MAPRQSAARGSRFLSLNSDQSEQEGRGYGIFSVGFYNADNSRLSGTRIWDQSPTPRRIGVEKLAVASAGMMILRRLKEVSQKKNRPPEEQEADSHAKFVSVLEMEPHTSPN